MTYKFYYSYRDELYGVIEHDKQNSILEVELLRKQEKEHINADWFLEQITKGRIDIGKDIDKIFMYEEKVLSDYLPTSA